IPSGTRRATIPAGRASEHMRAGARAGLLAGLLAMLPACRSPQAEPASTASPPRGKARVTEVARGLEHPWAVALLPDGDFLITERPGRVRRTSPDGRIGAPLAGVPTVWAHGQGGLLDVVLAPDFARSRRIYFSYAEPGDDGGAGTAAAT